MSLIVPAVEIITYSTCSIHEVENEGVVAKFLEANPSWTLSETKLDSTWHRRGKAYPGLSAADSQKLIRCMPEDGTSGFFACRFKKASNVSMPKSVRTGRTRHARFVVEPL